ncbi:hypothetical protein NADFUDRAFT_82570 [Nadsonia fulvescens var. elongata DSM 6958]|uniref:Uncharacterized protein n=1 Tax=Nadsonia fulvescens var. elongata DSM 6958 TaxID=857566 RepID=A0A1E3PJC5_9ASCO|nr:hypothetical protein NADFUDRAFT_82570 [Nadsonia fulvescens var. elongata DSM 6958]
MSYSHSHSTSISSIPVSIGSNSSLLSRYRQRFHSSLQPSTKLQAPTIPLTALLCTKTTNMPTLYMNTLAPVQYDLLLQQHARMDHQRDYKLIAKLQAACIRIPTTMDLAVTADSILTFDGQNHQKSVSVNGGNWKLAIHEFSNDAVSVMDEFLLCEESKKASYRYALVLYRYPKKTAPTTSTTPASQTTKSFPTIIPDTSRSNSLNITTSASVLRRPNRMSRFLRRNSHDESRIPRPVLSLNSQNPGQDNEASDDGTQEQFFVLGFPTLAERKCWIDKLLPILSLDHVTNTDSELDKRLKLWQSKYEEKVVEWVAQTEVYRHDNIMELDTAPELENDYHTGQQRQEDNLKKDNLEEDNSERNNLEQDYYDTSSSLTSIQEQDLEAEMKRMSRFSHLLQSPTRTGRHLHISKTHPYTNNSSQGQESDRVRQSQSKSHAYQRSIESNLTTGTYLTAETGQTSLTASPEKGAARRRDPSKLHGKSNAIDSDSDDGDIYPLTSLTGMTPLKSLPSVQSIVEPKSRQVKTMVEIVYSGKLPGWNSLSKPRQGPPSLALPLLPIK